MVRIAVYVEHAGFLLALGFMALGLRVGALSSNYIGFKPLNPKPVTKAETTRNELSQPPPYNLKPPTFSVNHFRDLTTTNINVGYSLMEDHHKFP